MQLVALCEQKSYLQLFLKCRRNNTGMPRRKLSQRAGEDQIVETLETNRLTCFGDKSGFAADVETHRTSRRENSLL